MATADQNKNSLTWVLGGALVLIGIFVIVGMVLRRSQADDVETTTTVPNVDPTISSVYISSSADGGADSFGSGINLTTGGTKTIHVNGVVEDLNGAADITNVNVMFYRSDVSGGAACTDDNNDCYKNWTCDTAAGSTSNRLTYNCPIALQYYTDSTDGSGPNGVAGTNWIARVAVTDGSATTTNSTNTVEVNTSMALTIPTTIQYGSLALGAETTDSNNQEMSIVQNGNKVTDVEVSTAAAMTCARGTIPIANQEWSLTDVSYGSGTDLSSSAADTNIGINTNVDDSDGSATNPSDGTRSIYWNIAIPSSGIEGSCTGTTVITAIAG